MTSPTMKRRASSERGFTLIEMMTVLAIIAILTAVLSTMASPGAGTPRTSSEETVGMIQFARLRAESTRVIHAVKFDGATQTISVWESAVSTTDPTPVVGYTAPVAWALVQNITLPANAKLHSAYNATHASGTIPGLTAGNLLPFEVQFYPDGGANKGATVLIGDQNNNASAFRIAIFRTTGGAIAREGW